MSDQAVFGIRIVGNNQTDKGARAAERRLGQVPRRVGDANRRYERESVASMRRVSRSTLRTFGEVERAGAQLLGGRAIASGAVSRLGGLTQAAGGRGRAGRSDGRRRPAVRRAWHPRRRGRRNHRDPRSRRLRRVQAGRRLGEGSGVDRAHGVHHWRGH